MKNTKLLFLFLLFLGIMTAQAQNLNGTAGSPTTFNTYDESMAGNIVPQYISLGFKKFKLSDWSVEIRTMGNFINQSTGSMVPPRYFKLLFNTVSDPDMVPANTGPIPLSTSETILIDGAPDLNQTTGKRLQYSFDFIIEGGNHLLVGDGTYSTTLFITLYEGSMIKANYSLQIGFIIDTQEKFENNILQLQNSASFIDFEFDDVADYANGLKVQKPLGLKVVSSDAYQIFVKTSSNQLISNTTSKTISVSNISLNITQPTGISNINLSGAVPLSSSEELMVENFHNPGHKDSQTVIYDLEYEISPINAVNFLGPAATYSTQVFFIMIPQ